MKPARLYLRASTDEQDSNRARADLEAFAKERGLYVAAVYTENHSGAQLERPELARLMADATHGDILLVESTDRLTRLERSEFETLKQRIAERGLRLVIRDLPTTFSNLDEPQHGKDDIAAAMMNLINNLVLDIAAAFAREDYTKRRQRQAQGIAKAKAEGKFTGRQKNEQQHAEVRALLIAGHTQQEITQKMVRNGKGELKPLASIVTVNKIAKTLTDAERAQAKAARAVIDSFPNYAE